MAISDDEIAPSGIFPMRESEVTKGNESLDIDPNNAVPRVVGGLYSAKRRIWLSNPLKPVIVIPPYKEEEHLASRLATGSRLQNPVQEVCAQEFCPA